MAARWWKFAAPVVALGFTMGLTACGEDDPNSFEAGDCTNDAFTGVVTEIETVDCEEEHAAEAFAQFDLDGDDDEFPGDEEIAAESERCAGDLFEDYVGTTFTESVFTANALPPTEESWENGDRTVICYIDGRTDGEALEGSAEGAEE